MVLQSQGITENKTLFPDSVFMAGCTRSFIYSAFSDSRYLTILKENQNRMIITK